MWKPLGWISYHVCGINKNLLLSFKVPRHGHIWVTANITYTFKTIPLRSSVEWLITMRMAGTSISTEQNQFLRGQLQSCQFIHGKVLQSKSLPDWSLPLPSVCHKCDDFTNNQLGTLMEGSFHPIGPCLNQKSQWLMINALLKTEGHSFKINI